MSAISGILCFGDSRTIRDELARMFYSLAAYGPDGCGLWHAGPIGLSHHLMRMTPEDLFERQPLIGGDEGPVLTADLRLDNRTELCDDLGMRPGDRAPTDSEILLECYKRWGDECPQHLTGEFAFALWDRRERRLFCARDHIGHRSFFFHQCRRFFAFASAPKAILALSGVPRRLNEQRVADHLVNMNGDQESTFYEEIFTLPAGHSLTVEVTGQRTIRRFWFLDPAREVVLGSDEAYFEAFRDLLSKVIRSQLRSAHPVGVMLSGGLDSASVACIAARLLKEQGKRLPAFYGTPQFRPESSSGSGRVNDDHLLVEAVAAHAANIDLAIVAAGICRRRMVTDWEHEQARDDSPVLNPLNLDWKGIYNEAFRSMDVRVVLNGTLGNYTASWEGEGYLAELARRGFWLTLAREVHALSRRRDQRRIGIFKNQVIIPLIPHRLWLRWRRWRDGGPPWVSYSVINPEFAHEMRVTERFLEFGFDPTFRPLPDGRANRARCFRIGSDHNQSRKAESGREPRIPLSDWRIVEFCLGIPQSLYFRDGRDRLFIRRAMTGIVPDRVLHRTQRDSPLPDWFQRVTAAREDFRDVLVRLEQSPTSRRCLDLERLRRLIDNWPDQPDFQYRYIVPTGIMTGLFILYMEQHNQ